MITRALAAAGLRRWMLQAMSPGRLGLGTGLGIRTQPVAQDEPGNAERRALFVCLRPPMPWLMDALRHHD